MTPLRLEAPGKLNLSLQVSGRRDDGFHELDGVMLLLEHADRLLLMPGCSGLRQQRQRRHIILIFLEERFTTLSSFAPAP